MRVRPVRLLELPQVPVAGDSLQFPQVLSHERPIPRVSQALRCRPDAAHQGIEIDYVAHYHLSSDAR